MAIASLLVSCNSHPKFETSVDAVEGCKKELAALKGEKEMSIEQLTKATSSWLETQDSAYSVFSRDTSINLRSPVALAFFVVSDSIRGELKRLAFSQPRSLNDVMYLKLNTATSCEKIEKADAYKEAISFFERLDKQDVFPTLKETLRAYYYLLSKAKPFRTEEQLIEFISKEDKCFRSLMTHLSEVSNEHLQQLTDATSKVYDGSDYDYFTVDITKAGNYNIYFSGTAINKSYDVGWDVYFGTYDAPSMMTDLQILDMKNIIIDYRTIYLNPGTYYFRIAGSYGNYSLNISQEVVQPAKSNIKKPKSTTIKKLKSAKKSVTIIWKKVSGVKGYQIQVATDKKFKKNKKTVTIKKQKTTKTSVKKLKAKKKYYVRIRTYKTVNGKKIYSSWSKVKSVKTK